MVVQFPKPKHLSDLRYHQLANSNARAQGLEPPKASLDVIKEAHLLAKQRLVDQAKNLDW